MKTVDMFSPDQPVTRLAGKRPQGPVPVDQGPISFEKGPVAADNSPADNSPEQRSLEQRSLEQRSLEQRSLEQRSLEQRGLEQKGLGQRDLEQKYLDSHAQRASELAAVLKERAARFNAVHKRPRHPAKDSGDNKIGHTASGFPQGDLLDGTLAYTATADDYTIESAICSHLIASLKQYRLDQAKQPPSKR